MRRFYPSGEEIAKDGLSRRPGWPEESQRSLAPGQERRYAAGVMNSYGAPHCCCRAYQASGTPRAVEAHVLRQ